MNRNRVISGAFAGAALLAATSCGISVSTPSSMNETNVEKKLIQVFEEQAGRKPDKIDCPGDLKGKKGSTMECTLTDGEDERAITVTVTKVEGSDIKYRYEFASTNKDGSAPVATLAEKELEERVANSLEEQVGQRPDEIDCPGDLRGKVGETMRCTLFAGPDSIGLTVAVTSVEGTSVKFDITVDES